MSSRELVPGECSVGIAHRRGGALALSMDGGGLGRPRCHPVTLRVAVAADERSGPAHLAPPPITAYSPTWLDAFVRRTAISPCCAA